MADIFVSYKSDDRAMVQLLASAFEQEGYSVWYDRGLRADDDYWKLIAKELDAAGAVVAVWSRRSEESRWVYSEADKADQQGKLINASLDGVIPPMPFNRKNSIDLASWSGSREAPSLQLLIASIQSLRTKKTGDSNKDKSASLGLTAARAWALIADSTTKPAYESFLANHGGSLQATLAREHLRALKRWDRVDKADPFAVANFVQTGPYAALGALAKDSVEKSKQEYIKKNVSRVTGSVGQMTGPKTAVSLLGMLALLPVMWVVVVSLLMFPFGVVGGLVHVLEREQSGIILAIEEFVRGILAWDLFEQLHIDTSVVPVVDVVFWLLTVSGGLLVLVIVFGLIGLEAGRASMRLDKSVRRHYEDKVALL